MPDTDTNRANPVRPATGERKSQPPTGGKVECTHKGQRPILLGN